MWTTKYYLELTRSLVHYKPWLQNHTVSSCVGDDPFLPLSVGRFAYTPCINKRRLWSVWTTLNTRIGNMEIVQRNCCFGYDCGACILVAMWLVMNCVYSLYLCTMLFIGMKFMNNYLLVFALLLVGYCENGVTWAGQFGMEWAGVGQQENALRRYLN